MLQHTKWKGKDPNKVIKTKEFPSWLIEQVQKTALTTCLNCGKELELVEKHTYKCNCSPGIYISIG